ncbi:hypothetical protein [Pseudonocardia sp.]
MRPAERRGVALAIRPWYFDPDANDHWSTAILGHDADVPWAGPDG